MSTSKDKSTDTMPEEMLEAKDTASSSLGASSLPDDVSLDTNSGSAAKTDSASKGIYGKNVGEVNWLKVATFLILVTLLVLAVRYEFFGRRIERPSALIAKLKVEFESKKYAEAFQTADKGILLFPYEPYFHFYKAKILSEKGFKKKALDEIMVASRASSDFPISVLRAQLLADCGNTQAALSDFERLSRTYEGAKDPEVLEGKIKLEVKMGAIDRAVEDIDRAIKADPKNVSLYVTRAKLLTRLSHYSRAQEDWTKVISLSPRNALAFAERAFIEYKTNQLEKANSDITSSLKIAPTTAAYYNRGVMSADKKHTQAAAADFLEALKLDPANLSAIEALGKIYGEQPNYEAALAKFDTSLESVAAKNSPYYYQGRAALKSAAGRYKESISDLNKAASDGSNSESVRASLAQCYLAMGDLPSSYRLYSHLLEDNPQRYDLYLKRGRVASRQHRFSLAAADFANAASLMPDPYEGYMLEGQALSDAKTFGVALVCFKHALRLKPGNEEARLKVAECTRAKETERLNANRPDREELAYQSKLRSVATADSQRLKAIGYDALQNGDADYAELALTRAIKLKPNDPVLRQYMTGALLSEGKYSQAVNQFLAWDQISKLTLLDKLIFVKRIPDRDVASKFYSVLIEQNARDAHSLYSIALDCEGQSLKPETEAAIVAGLKVADDVNRHRLLSLQTQLKDKEKEEYQKFTPEEIAKLKSYVQPKRN